MRWQKKKRKKVVFEKSLTLGSVPCIFNAKELRIRVVSARTASQLASFVAMVDERSIATELARWEVTCFQDCGEICFSPSSSS